MSGTQTLIELSRPACLCIFRISFRADVPRGIADAHKVTSQDSRTCMASRQIRETEPSLHIGTLEAGAASMAEAADLEV